MKSKLLAFAILACGLMALTGCKNSDGKKSDEKEKTEQSAAEQESVVLNAGEDEITAEKDFRDELQGWGAGEFSDLSP